MIDLVNKIGLEENLKQKILSVIDSKNVSVLVDKCQNGFGILATKDPVTCAAVAILYAEKYTFEKYKALGIGEDVFVATISDIAIWCYNNKNKGLKNIGWIKNHLNAELFRLGRLQFQIYPCKNKTLDYENLPFGYGENLVYVHIPQGEKLFYPDCVNSIKMAKQFFSDYFPNYDFQYFFCESWLLFEDNWMFMAPNCNILQFQSLFNIAYNVSNGHQAIERIFGKKHILKSLYPTNTSLQKSTVEFLKHGGKLGEGIGVLNKNDI